MKPTVWTEELIIVYKKHVRIWPSSLKRNQILDFYDKKNLKFLILISYSILFQLNNLDVYLSPNLTLKFCFNVTCTQLNCSLSQIFIFCSFSRQL